MKATVGGIFSDTMDFLKANWLVMIGMMAAAAAALGILGYLMLGSFFSQAMMGAQPDPAMIMAMMSRFFLLYLLMLVVMNGTMLSVWRHGMTNGQDPVTGNLGWALLGGLTLTLLYFGLLIAVYIALAIIMLILFALVGGGVGMFGPGGFSPQAMAGPTIFLVIVFYVAFLVASLWLWARLAVIGPVMAAGRTANSFTGLTQSWSLTRASQWTIVGFFLLVIIGSVVIFLVAGGVVTALRMPALMLLLYIPFLLFWLAVPPGIYRQVATTDRGAVFA